MGKFLDENLSAISTLDPSHEPMSEKEPHQRFEAFKGEQEKQPDAENKLKSAIAFMEEALAQDKTPDFKNFWEVRKICLDLFKEQMPPPVRSQLWNRYHELSKEARRLKDILDEQSNFASEQIEIAIQALEKEISQIAQAVEASESLSFKALENQAVFYGNLQKELNLLNAYASRVNALRKELIKTEMRIRIKNRFFQRLSAIGDQIFPRRKELIQKISEQFAQDVDQFITEHFAKFDQKESVFALREEIKALQGSAKMLTLNTQVFNQTRLRLSECWDKLKSVEKEKKKEFAHKKEAFKANAQMISQSIADLAQKFTTNEISIVEMHKEMDQTVGKMRATELGRDEVHALREELSRLRQTVLEKEHEVHAEKQRVEAERNERKKTLMDNFSAKNSRISR